MPATFQKTYKYVAPDGEQFDTLAEEQAHELEPIMPAGQLTAKDIATSIVSKAVAIVAILSQKERKHASPVKRTRKAKAAPEAKA